MNMKDLDQMNENSHLDEVVCLVSMVPWEVGKAVQHGCFFWLLDHGL